MIQNAAVMYKGLQPPASLVAAVGQASATSLGGMVENCLIYPVFKGAGPPPHPPEVCGTMSLQVPVPVFGCLDEWGGGSRPLNTGYLRELSSQQNMLMRALRRLSLRCLKTRCLVGPDMPGNYAFSSAVVSK